MWLLYLFVYLLAYRVLPIDIVVIIWATHVLAKLHEIFEKGYIIK